MAEPKSYIRLFHAIPDAPKIDMYVNDTMMAEAVEYKEFSKYFEAIPGIYNIKITPSKENTLIVDLNIEIIDKGIYTLCMIGTLSMASLELIYDIEKSPDKTKGYIRYINLSPPQSDFNIYMDKTLVTSELDFQEVTRYQPHNPGTYRFTVTNSITNKPVLTHPKVKIGAGRQYAGYIVGVEGKGDGLEVVLPLEGATYLKF